MLHILSHEFKLFNAKRQGYPFFHLIFTRYTRTQFENDFYFDGIWNRSLIWVVIYNLIPF
jgi:hypothetical protein